LQNMRRAAGFDIADHIETSYSGDQSIGQIMVKFADYIKQETLSKEFNEGEPPDGAYVEAHKIDGHELTLAVIR